MFYVNNEQVKGILLNGRNYNYLSCSFGKIIPEDRNSVQLNLNLAYKYLNQYRIEYGTVKDGYENALVSPRFDKPDYNGIFHTPFTYYYGGSIIPTKEVNILITDGNYALRNALVYNDMNINGAINYFATNTDFQGHNVNVFPEKDNYQSSPLLDHEMLNNCSNFDLNISTRFSKSVYPTLYNCNNFSGNFRYVGNSDSNYPGFRGFLYQCKDGVFNIDCTNMHGGGSDANVRNYYNFIGLQSCENMQVNITGSSWQVWPHDHSFTSNCNINTYNVISGFSYMNYCNFNVELPKDSKPEMSNGFEFLNKAENCNYNLNALDSNLFNYRSVGYVPFFENLNNCNLNLQVNNAVEFGDSLGGNLHNCNIVFDNIKGNLIDRRGWGYLYNCNISGNVEAASSVQGFIEYCDGLNVNLNCAKSSRILPMYGCNNVNGNLVAGNTTYVSDSSYLNLKVSKGGLSLINVSNSYVRANNTLFSIHKVNDTNIYSDGGHVGIIELNNCNNLTLSGLAFELVSNNMWFSDIYNSYIKLGTFAPEYNAWRVHDSFFSGFPHRVSYAYNCVFSPFAMDQVAQAVGEVENWWNLWPHRTLAGMRSVNNIENCRIETEWWDSGGSITFNNVNNMQTSVGTYYDETVTASLPIYNMAIKFNVDCNTLNLVIFQGGPPHGFENSCISANTIYAKNRSEFYIQADVGTRIYCENYCNTAIRVGAGQSYDTLNQPVVLINNHQTYNSSGIIIYGGLTRIGRLNYQGGAPAPLTLGKGACLFINNALLGYTTVYQNAVLFLGSNVTWANGTNVLDGGLIVTKENWGSYANEIRSRMGRGHLCWNIWDSGPWGPQSLFDFCTNV